jgi:hypothetical protein
LLAVSPNAEACSQKRLEGEEPTGVDMQKLPLLGASIAVN